MHEMSGRLVALLKGAPEVSLSGSSTHVHQLGSLVPMTPDTAARFAAMAEAHAGKRALARQDPESDRRH